MNFVFSRLGAAAGAPARDRRPRGGSPPPDAHARSRRALRARLRGRARALVGASGPVLPGHGSTRSAAELAGLLSVRNHGFIAGKAVTSYYVSDSVLPLSLLLPLLLELQSEDYLGTGAFARELTLLIPLSAPTGLPARESAHLAPSPRGPQRGDGLAPGAGGQELVPGRCSCRHSSPATHAMLAVLKSGERLWKAPYGSTLCNTFHRMKRSSRIEFPRLQAIWA